MGPFRELPVGERRGDDALNTVPEPPDERI